MAKSQVRCPIEEPKGGHVGVEGGSTGSRSTGTGGKKKKGPGVRKSVWAGVQNRTLRAGDETERDAKKRKTCSRGARSRVPKSPRACSGRGRRRVQLSVQRQQKNRDGKGGGMREWGGWLWVPLKKEILGGGGKETGECHILRARAVENRKSSEAKVSAINMGV